MKLYNPIKFKLLHPEAKPPLRGYGEGFGLDLAVCSVSESGRPNVISCPPNMTRKIPTGLAVESPPGTGLWLCSRSGLAMKSLFVANSPGLIDPDYRGEIFVLLFNGGHESFRCEHGMRIAQLCIAPLIEPKFEIVDELSPTPRGEAGFGSTGL